MGGKGSGGANGGPQYNPANVNGLGGNGILASIEIRVYI